MRDFYPAIEPFHSGFIQVSNIHQIYFEQVGNPQGQPILFLHGGPGGGINSDHRRFFNPDKYHIILFDQRGSGKSQPCAELQENSTWHLIDDIESLRKKLNVKQWIVFGGSWGSTLALTYAIKHPETTQGLILRGIFLCRPSEIQWFYQNGASQIFPDIWEQYEQVIPSDERHDFVQAYYKRLTHENVEIKIEAAKAWSKWEAATSRLYVDPQSIDEFDNIEHALSFARIECHYFINNAFFPTENYILENIDRIRHIPGVIVQGRYDVVCPAKSAWELHKAWPEAEFHIVSDAGHAAGEPGIKSLLIQAADQFLLKAHS